jgi:hypothetical protein
LEAFEQDAASIWGTNDLSELQVKPAISIVEREKLAMEKTRLSNIAKNNTANNNNPANILKFIDVEEEARQRRDADRELRRLERLRKEAEMEQKRLRVREQRERSKLAPFMAMDQAMQSNGQAVDVMRVVVADAEKSENQQQHVEIAKVEKIEHQQQNVEEQQQEHQRDVVEVEREVEIVQQSNDHVEAPQQQQQPQQSIVDAEIGDESVEEDESDCEGTPNRVYHTALSSPVASTNSNINMSNNNNNNNNSNDISRKSQLF